MDKSKFAVIATGGKQYQVSEGDTIVVEKLSSLVSPIKNGENVVFENVLLINDGDNTQIGAPNLSGVRVEGTLISEKKGKKVLGVKYKAKSNRRVKYGHRQVEARVKIVSIS